MRPPRLRFTRLAPAGILILGLVALPAVAAPGNGGPPEHAQGGQGAQGAQGQSERLRRDPHDRDGRERREARQVHEERRHDDRDHDRDRYRHDGPRLEEALIREVFHRHRDAYAYDEREPLPPGIRQNLARGKPMPPGIGKRFDERIRRDLPHYDGYEWRRVGADAVLVDLTNDIIHSVIHDVLD